MVLHSTEAKTKAHSPATQTYPGLNGESFLFLTGWRVDPDPAALWIGSYVSLGAAPGHLVLLLSSLSPSLQAFTREGKRPDQMGSVIRCYYSTDRACFSSWSYLEERVESLLLSQNSGDTAQDEIQDHDITLSPISEAYQHTHCSFFHVGLSESM